MTNSDPLSLAVTAFELWRKTRSTRKGLTPQHLREQAVALKSHYVSSKITRALRISGTQFKQWLQDSKTNEETFEFVQMPATHLSQTAETKESDIELELSFAQGGQLRLSGQLSSALLSTLIKEMRA